MMASLGCRFLFIVIVFCFPQKVDGAPTSDPATSFLNHIHLEVSNMWPSMDYTNDNRFDDNDLVLFLYHYDVDKNGTIEQSEFETNFDMTEPSLALLAKGLFLEFDADKSGHINMSDLQSLYSHMDLNKDGVVSKPEFTQYFTEVLTVIAIIHLRNLGFS